MKDDIPTFVEMIDKNPEESYSTNVLEGIESDVSVEVLSQYLKRLFENKSEKSMLVATVLSINKDVMTKIRERYGGEFTAKLNENELIQYNEICEGKYEWHRLALSMRL